jgi:hypothetical protein
MVTETKSPNRLWRESGTSLSFADWIQREKDKGAFLANKKFDNFSNANGLIDSDTWIEQVKSQARINLGIDKVVDDKKKKDNTFIGLNKNILILSGIIVIGAIGYKIYQKRK